MNAPDEVKKVTIKGVVKDKKRRIVTGCFRFTERTTIGVATDER